MKKIQLLVFVAVAFAACQKEYTDPKTGSVHSKNVSNAYPEGYAWFNPGISTKSSYIGTDDGSGNINGTFMVYSSHKIVTAKFIVSKLCKGALLSSSGQAQMWVSVDGDQPVVFGPGPEDTVGEVTFTNPLGSDTEFLGGTKLPVRITFNKVKNIADSSVTFAYTLLSFTTDNGSEYRDSIPSANYRLVGSYPSFQLSAPAGRLQNEVVDTFGVATFDTHGGPSHEYTLPFTALLKNASLYPNTVVAIDEYGNVIPCTFTSSKVVRSDGTISGNFTITFTSQYGYEIAGVQHVYLLGKFKLQHSSKVMLTPGDPKKNECADDRYYLLKDNAQWFTLDDWNQTPIYPRLPR